ncbi:hypothetical protein, partial [Crocosphaera watsonii]|uniref:hypothetical protein n=1 Tax=Crocosphaera watsonii TaxID=263511 RepID=UPI0030DA73C9
MFVVPNTLLIPPPFPEAELPETVLWLRVKFSLLLIPPPLPEELPCVIVKPLILTTCCVLESPSSIL